MRQVLRGCLVAGLACVAVMVTAEQPDTPWHPPSTTANNEVLTEALWATTPTAGPVLASLAGDRDNFGFGTGPINCGSFDKRGPADLGVFDVSAPSAHVTDCDFTGSWAHTFTPPAGGVGAFTIHVVSVFPDSGGGFLCDIAPCGCTNNEQLLLDGVAASGFLPDSPSCTQVIHWSQTFTGPQANAIAGDGVINVQFAQNFDEIALDYAEIVNVLGATEVSVKDGNGQKGAVSNTLEKPLRVQLTTQDTNVSVAGVQLTFRIVGTPANASDFAIGADESATATTYTVTTDADGIASAILVLGNKAGAYTVQVDSPLSATGAAAVFTETAKKPASVVVLKDTTDLADLTPTYAVSATRSTTFFAVGLDTDGSKLGPVKSKWSVSASGSQPTRGSGNADPRGRPA